MVVILTGYGGMMEREVKDDAWISGFVSSCQGLLIIIWEISKLEDLIQVI